MNDAPVSVAKVLGADFELANALLGKVDRPTRQAANLLLAELPGYPCHQVGGTAIEYGRRFLDSCGSSWYIDSDHLEGNLPEHRSALDHPGVLYGAGFAHAQRALQAVQQELPDDTRLNLLANCSDGRTSWGSHLNVLITRDCFTNLIDRKPQDAGFLATHLVTSVPYTGQGMVGAANGRPACAYQMSQRADWFERFYGPQTMFERPLINVRDESHAADELARLHIIFFDMVLAPVANLLKAGTTQLILAMIEAGWTDSRLSLDDPVGAASEISRDLQLQTRFRNTVRGRAMTAVEIQQALANLAGEFVASGAADGIVPGAEQILTLWLETLDLLRHRDIEALAARCDVWLKYLLLDRHRGQLGVAWSSEDIRVADSRFASLDREVSLFFQMATSGLVEQMPDNQTVERFASEPPDDTRAYFRAHVLRRFGNTVSWMDWSHINFRVPDRGYWWSIAEIPMRDPRRLSRSETDGLLSTSTTLEDFVVFANARAADLPELSSRNGRP